MQDAPCLSSSNGYEKNTKCRHVDDCSVLVLVLFDNDYLEYKWMGTEGWRGRTRVRGQVLVETWQLVFRFTEGCWLFTPGCFGSDCFPWRHGSMCRKYETVFSAKTTASFQQIPQIISVYVQVTRPCRGHSHYQTFDCWEEVGWCCYRATKSALGGSLDGLMAQ